MNILHLILYFFSNPKNSNTTTCAITQIRLLTMALYNLFLSLLNSDKNFVIERTINTLLFFTSFFIYDIFYIIFVSKSLVFFIHHIISLITLYIAFYLGITYEICVYLNLFILAIEGASPFINIRPIMKGTRYEKIFDHIVFLSFTIIRIVLYPIAYFLMYYQWKKIVGYVNFYVEFFAYTKFIVLYGMSLVWSKKLWKYSKFSLW